jgi:hypothetical protein
LDKIQHSYALNLKEILLLRKAKWGKKFNSHKLITSTKCKTKQFRKFSLRIPTTEFSSKS